MTSIGEPVDHLRLVSSVIAEKYAIERVLCNDDFTIEYSGTQLIVNHPVVVRVLAGLVQVEGHARARLYNRFLADQAKLAELSGTPGLRHIRDSGIMPAAGGDWVPFAVEDNAEGRPLWVVLEEQRRSGTAYTLSEAVLALDPIAVALASAHEAGLAHGRVSQDNVWVLGGAMTLSNFGFARLAAHARAVSERPPSMDGPLRVAGAQATGLHPELDSQVDLHEVQSDVRGLASLLLLMSGPAQPMMYPAANAVLVRALHASATECWKNAGEFWRALREAIGLPALRSLMKTLPPDVLPDATPDLEARLRHTRRVILSATLLLVGVAVGVLWTSCSPRAADHLEQQIQAPSSP